MRLVCNGVALDLYKDTSLQFKKSNPMFSFDEMSAERTVEFSIPSTPKNDQVFVVARVPAYDGMPMRRKFAAQLQNGIVSNDGFLYISEFDGKDYKGVFVSGLAYDIKMFGNKEYGKLYLQFFDEDELYNSNDNNLPIIAKVKHHYTDDSKISDWWTCPSIDIGKLFTELNTQGIFKISGMTGDQIRLVRRGFPVVFEDVKERMQVTGVTTEQTEPIITKEIHTDIDGRIMRIEPRTIYYSHNPDEPYAALTVNFFRIYELPTKIKFAEDTPDNLCLAMWTNNGLEFLGTRRVEIQGGQKVYVGKPLAGTTVSVGGGSELLLVTADIIELTPYNTIIFDYTNIEQLPLYNVNVLVSADYTEDDEEAVYYSTINYAILHDVKFGDLIKAYSVCVGKSICVRADGSVEFTNELDAPKVLRDIIDIKNIRRTFSDYAQKNTIGFNNDGTEDWELIVKNYEIDNENIEEQKNIFESKYSAGGQYPKQTPPFTRDNPLIPIPANCPLLIEFNEQEEPLKIAAAETLALAGGTDAYMRRVDIKHVELLQRLCDASTQISVHARMPFFEFEQIDSKNTFNVNNTIYAWTEAAWQKDVATLTLQKLE